MIIMDVWIVNNININQYDEIIINYDSIKNISCFEGSDGHLSILHIGWSLSI